MPPFLTVFAGTIPWQNACVTCIFREPFCIRDSQTKPNRIVKKCHKLDWLGDRSASPQHRHCGPVHCEWHVQVHAGRHDMNTRTHASTMVPNVKHNQNGQAKQTTTMTYKNRTPSQIDIFIRGPFCGGPAAASSVSNSAYKNIQSCLRVRRLVYKYV